MPQQFGSARTDIHRPQLPYAHANPYLSLTETKPAVKYQVITRENVEILVARIKVQTPGGGHAFILRRFDTDALSQTTMFRAAFPSASEDAEKLETSWVKQTFLSNGKELVARLRLAGTWVPPDVAKTLATDYALEGVLTPLIEAIPDPLQNYRRSTKGTSSPQVNGTPKTSTVSTTQQQSSPSPTAPPSKRSRKDASPAPASPKSATDSLPVPRRSGRTTSPIPPSMSMTTSTATNTSRVTRSSRAATTTTTTTTVAKGTRSSSRTAGKNVLSRLTPAESDHANADEEGDGEIAEIPGPNMLEDIAEQKEMIARLKAEREAREVTTTYSAADLDEPSQDEGEKASQVAKRTREDANKPLHFDFNNAVEHTLVPRPIASNSRLRLNLEPQQKSAAWGALWFAAGLAAAATIPSFFM